MQASKQVSPAMHAAYEAVLTSAQCFPGSETAGEETVVQLSLQALNDLLRLVGLPDIEAEGIPSAGADVSDGALEVYGAEGAEGAEAGHWTVGTIAEISKENGVAVITCAAVEEQFSKQVNANLDDLRAQFRGDLALHIGAEVMFPLNWDEEDNFWAGPPVFASTHTFTGTIKAWKGKFGFIKCDELDPFVTEGVYMHGNAARRGKVPTAVGQLVAFNMHVSELGRIQASSPKPVGGGHGPMYAEQPPKRPRIEQQDPRAKGKGHWSPSLGLGPPGYGSPAGAWSCDGWGGKTGGKSGLKDGGKSAWYGSGDGGKASCKGTGGCGGKGGGGAGPEWYEGTLTSYSAEKGFGFITGSGLGDDVYVHTSVVEKCGGYNGCVVQFKVHISSQGKPQASNPMYVLR